MKYDRRTPRTYGCTLSKARHLDELLTEATTFVEAGYRLGYTYLTFLVSSPWPELEHEPRWIGIDLHESSVLMQSPTDLELHRGGAPLYTYGQIAELEQLGWSMPLSTTAELSCWHRRLEPHRHCRTPSSIAAIAIETLRRAHFLTEPGQLTYIVEPAEVDHDSLSAWGF